MSQHKKEVAKQNEIESNIDTKEKPVAAAKEHAKPKQYTVESLKTPLTKDEKKEFDELDKDEQKKFIIKKWTAENRYLDTIDCHEISLEDQQLAGLIPVQTPS